MTRLGVGAALVDGQLVEGDVTLDGGYIAHVGGRATTGGLVAAPGFVDLQVNGFAGVDLVSASAEGFAEVSEALAATGVTAYQPTFITGDVEQVAAAVRRVRDVVGEPQRGAQVLGAHLEGPFLSEQRAGTHPVHQLCVPQLEWVEQMLASGPVTQVTLAPELPGALAVIDRLRTAGVVVACGHSDADAATAHRAFDRGASAVTHLFNAMRPLHHREPGLVGVALSRDGVTVPIIADGIHLAPEIVKLTWAAARDRLALVTDATAAAGCPDGDFDLGDVKVHKTGLEVRRADGTLAGSALTMDAAIRNAVAAGVPLAAALDAASCAPARLLGRSGSGGLDPGMPADVVILDEDLRVVRVFKQGQEIA